MGRVLMQDQWFYSGWVPPVKHSRSRVAVPTPCVALLTAEHVAPHGEGMALASLLLTTRFGPPPTSASRPRPVGETRPPAGLGESALGRVWSMERLFNEWCRAADTPPGVMLCPVCLRPMRRRADGGWPVGRRILWTTVDHIIHRDHEECYWCVWPMCNECNSSKLDRDFRVWLPARLADIGDDVDAVRAAMRAGWRELVASDEGHLARHDCDHPAGTRKSHGCAAGCHQLRRPWWKDPDTGRVKLKAVCTTPHCDYETKWRWTSSRPRPHRESGWTTTPAAGNGVLVRGKSRVGAVAR